MNELRRGGEREILTELIGLKNPVQGWGDLGIVKREAGSGKLLLPAPRFFISLFGFVLAGHRFILVLCFIEYKQKQIAKQFGTL
ncbi:MAG: hypothetical protein WAN11_14280 [Syntrophobacteraceae bacterium]